MWKRYISKARKEGVDFGLSKWTEENERATMAQVELRSSLSQDLNISTRYNPLADVSRMPANLQEEARASIIMSKQELLLATRPRSDRNIGADNNGGDGYYGGDDGSSSNSESDSDRERDSVMTANPMVYTTDSPPPPPPSSGSNNGSPGSPSPPALRPYSGRKTMGRPNSSQMTTLGGTYTYTGEPVPPPPPSGSPMGSPLLRPYSGGRTLSSRLMSQGSSVNSQEELL